MNSKNDSLKQPYYLAGTAILALRLIVGWTYFSAFWRRVVLENKLDPDTAGYIGEKFNHFLPNALGIKPLIEYLVTHPDILYIAMIGFTVIEAIAGLMLMLGLFTRLAGLIVIVLALGILLGSGWIGTTCLDEWQIGILGIGGGFSLLLAGSGSISIDCWLQSKKVFSGSKWFRCLGSGALPINFAFIQRVAIAGAFSFFLLTLYTNQYFHGGVWGELHNKSVKPKIEISGARIEGNKLEFDLYRVEGADVYGSFLIGITLKDDKGVIIFDMDSKDLSRIKKEQIDNYYIAHVKPGRHSLVIPLGSKATISLTDDMFAELPSSGYELILTDVSGIEWKQEITK